MRAARGPDDPSQGGIGGGAPPPPVHDDRSECGYCGRKFNENAYDRHVVHCEKKHKETMMKRGPPKGKGHNPRVYR